MTLRNRTLSAMAVRCAAAALCLLVPVSSFAGAEHSARYEDTNVILISLQCLRPDHLGAYGYKRDTSPNIDALARKSVLFENAIAQANLTPVAQMSVFTSQYPRVHGLVSFEVSRDMVTQRTLPEILRYYGYTTAAAVSSPEFFMRFDTASGTVVNPGDVFSRSFDQFSRSIPGPGGKSLRRVPTEALQWIRNNKDKKFFLWIASGLLHMPYAAAVPQPYQTRYDPPGYTPFWKRLPGLSGDITEENDPSYEVFSRVHRNEFYWDFAPLYRLRPDDVAYVNARYDAGVYYTDLFIGDLMKLLDSLDLTKKTLVIIQSIHGDDLGEQGDFFHYDITDRVVKNALVMHFPGGEFGGKRVPQQVQGIDIMPTVLRYLDIPVPHEAQGVSLLPLLRGDAGASGDEYVYIDRLPWWEYNLSRWYLDFLSAKGDRVPAGERKKLDAYRAMLKKSFDQLDYPPGDIAIRTNKWKLVIRKNKALLDKVSWWRFITGTRQDVDAVALYDLEKDPAETTNIAEKRPDIVAELRAKLLQWDASMERRKAAYPKDEKRYIIPYP